MLILGLDTALQSCSVAILRDDDVIASRVTPMERGHAEHLAPMAAEALSEAGVNSRDLDRIGVVMGPGGFTGVRVALSFARGLALAAKIPCVGVTSLAALAANIAEPGGNLIAPVIDARRGQVYAALYSGAHEMRLPPFVADPKEALQRLAHEAGKAGVTLIGTGAPLLAETPPTWGVVSGGDQIDARTVARLAGAAPAPAPAPAPLYLRSPDAKPPKPGRFAGVNVL